MNILIMGPAGSGKGTVSKKIAEEFNIPHISTGDMFREAMANETALGKLARTYIDEGRLVPDDVTIAMAKERILREDCEKGYILDGFPRTLNQAVEFEKIADENNRKIEFVLDLDMSIDELTTRITNRRVCKNCGAIFNDKFRPSKVHGICDDCGGELIQRSDDTEESLKIRMEEYNNLTQPAIDYFEEKGLVVKIAAGQSKDDVWNDIKSVLEK